MTREMLTDFRLKTHKWRPYFAKLIYAMPVYERAGIGTLCVDQYARCYYDPEFVRTLTPDQGAYCLLHEAMHVLLRHCRSVKEMIGPTPSAEAKERANIAVDIVVEQLLADMRGHVPACGVQSADLYGFPQNLTWQEYYRLLSKKDEQGKDDHNPTPSKEADDGERDDGGVDTEDDAEPDDAGDGEGDQQDDDAQGEGDPEDGDADGEGKDTGGSAPSPEAEEDEEVPQPMGMGGSCADGVSRDYEEPADPSWESHREDHTLIEMENSESFRNADAAGSVPAWVKQVLNHRLRPQPDVWDQLRSAVASSVASPVGSPEFTYRRFSRRQQPDMPRLKGKITNSPTAVVILDTSGSMCSGEDQAKALTVIAQGLRRLSSFRVFAGDTTICSDKRVSNIQQIEWVGGGGTNMARLIEDVDKKFQPDSIVLVTDGYTPWPATKPRARVVVALTQQKGDSFPSWARAFEIGSQQEG